MSHTGFNSLPYLITQSYLFHLLNKPQIFTSIPTQSVLAFLFSLNCCINLLTVCSKWTHSSLSLWNELSKMRSYLKSCRGSSGFWLHVYLQGIQHQPVNALRLLKDHEEPQTSRSSQNPQSKPTHTQARENYRKKKSNWTFPKIPYYRCFGYGKKRIWTLMRGDADSLGKAWACL